MKITSLTILLSCIGFHEKRDSSKSSNSDRMYQLSGDPEFHYEILRAMSATSSEGADIGELLVTAQKIKPGDFESYYAAFNELATRVHEQAKSIDGAKHPFSARNTFFRASTYYRSADFFLHGNWSDTRINTLWSKQLDAFNSAMSLLPVPGQRIILNAKDDNFTIPAIFFGSGKPGPQPTIILGNGYDGSQEEMFHVVGEAALQRGMNVITYEGPGQPSVRRYQDLGFIPQWERVLTPVVDFALTRPEVDPHSIGLWGYSFGGYLAPRAAAFEHRLAAVFAMDGVYDFGQTILANLPDPVKKLYDSRNETAVNSILNDALASDSMPTSARWSLQQGMWSFNVKSPYEFIRRSQLYNLTSVSDKIQAPVFVGSAENDTFFPGQAKKLSEALGSKATYHLFKAADGAGEHCSVGASALVNQVTLDWFEDILRRRS
ncbi:2,6-dihydropseudooxynicotine hydrolase [Mariannaea sp. PMI_226]|nr:2,6-dihydropseudooxynicotine hydrolase [Mariannaea sp. PMI_226]